MTNFAKRIKKMENKIRVNGLVFKPYISKEKIDREVKRLAEELREELEGAKPIFLCVLNGAFIFAADLFREIGIDDAKINFVKYSSYEGTESTGNVKEIIGLNEDLTGMDVVIIEDIVDTGLTAEKMVSELKRKNPRSLRFVTLLYKPDNSKNDFKPDHIAFTIPPKFILGYGLDLDGKGRNLKDIYVIDEE